VRLQAILGSQRLQHANLQLNNCLSFKYLKKALLELQAFQMSANFCSVIRRFKNVCCAKLNVQKQLKKKTQGQTFEKRRKAIKNLLGGLCF